MPSTIQFLRDPRYTDTVILFILSPAGVPYAVKDIGHNLFGTDDWIEDPLLIEGLSPKPGFRYSDISFHWTDFLDLAFRHVDHALFYVPHKSTFKEIRKESLLQQNPDLYSFSFRKFYCEVRKGMVLPPPEEETPIFPLPRPVAAESRTANELKPVPTQKPVTAPVISKMAANTLKPANMLKEGRETLLALLASGWSANAVAKQTDITAMTIGSIKNGKSSQMSTRVHGAIMRMKSDADAGRISPATRKTQAAALVQQSSRGALNSTAPVSPTGAQSSTAWSAKEPTPVHSTAIAGKTARGMEDMLVNSRLIAVDTEQLMLLLDRLGSIFIESVEDLQEIRSMLSQK